MDKRVESIMQHKRISFLLLISLMLIVLLTSCGRPMTKFQQVERLPRQAPPTQPQWSLEGEYQNSVYGGDNSLYLWQSLKYLRGVHWLKASKHEICGDCKVKIALQETKRIHFYLLKSGEVVDSVEFKGQFSQNTFYLKTQVAAHGAFPLFWVWMGSHLQIGLDDQGNLVIGDEYHGKVMLVLFPGFVDSGETWQKYRREESGAK